MPCKTGFGFDDAFANGFQALHTLGLMLPFGKTKPACR
jgi:hypothetical protein